MTLRHTAASLAVIGLLTASAGLSQAQAAPGVPSALKTCAQGGVCEVGDIGPAGGTVIYVGDAVINVAAPISAGGRYLEAAPANWRPGGDFMGAWCPNVLATVGLAAPIGTAAEVGSGALNTAKMSARCSSTGGLATIVNLSLNGYSDWFLPSEDELLALAAAGAPLKSKSTDCYGGSCYWSSTEDPEDLKAVARALNNVQGLWVMGANDKEVTTTYFRPIRAFGNPLPITAKPNMTKPTVLKGGFRLEITNYTNTCRWSAQATRGKAVISDSGVVIVSGLSESQLSSVTVIKRCSGYQPAWNTKAGHAKA